MASEYESKRITEQESGRVGDLERTRVREQDDKVSINLNALRAYTATVPLTQYDVQ